MGKVQAEVESTLSLFQKGLECVYRWRTFGVFVCLGELNLPGM